MSQFLDKLWTEVVTDTISRVVDHPFRYQSDVAGLFTVPIDFRTDFESMVRWVPTLYAILGDQNKEPAVIHDWIYYSAVVDRKTADDVFFEACGVIGTPLWKRRMLWTGLRVGGWHAWNDHRKEGHPETGRFKASPDIIEVAITKGTQ